ncbi:MAG TPA: hypothetical protein VMJ75_26865 [Candidatus Acidoferrales bacterium]|nr:hypothetical protein [Candidatus Acidoferrales bacterium]
MNLAIPDVRTLEMHPPSFGYLKTSCRRSSGASGRSELGVPLLLGAIRDAAALGYNFLSIAGDQALAHPALGSLCREAHRMNMLTTLTARGAALSARRLKPLTHSVDLLGVKFEADVAPSLETVRRSGIPFAVVYPLTAANMGEMEKAAAFAAARGAAMLNVRPVEELSDQQMATVWMMVECLRDMHRGELAVQFEVLSRYDLPIESDDLDGWRAGLETDTRFLGELISPMVIEEDGTIVPLRHGFPRSLALGNLRDGTMAELASRWIHSGAPNFCRIYRTVLRDARLFGDLPQLLAEQAGAASFSAAG